MTVFGIDTHQTNTSRALWLGAATLIVGLAVIVSVDWWVSPAVAILVHLAVGRTSSCSFNSPASSA